MSEVNITTMNQINDFTILMEIVEDYIHHMEKINKKRMKFVEKEAQFAHKECQIFDLLCNNFKILKERNGIPQD